MNNPYKIIGLSFIASIIGIFGLFELPKMARQFSDSEWIVSILFSALIVFSLLASLYINAHKINKISKSNN
jgi:hypothetical protein